MAYANNQEFESDEEYNMGLGNIGLQRSPLRRQDAGFSDAYRKRNRRNVRVPLAPGVMQGYGNQNQVVKPLGSPIRGTPEQKRQQVRDFLEESRQLNHQTVLSGNAIVPTTQGSFGFPREFAQTIPVANPTVENEVLQQFVWQADVTRYVPAVMRGEKPSRPFAHINERVRARWVNHSAMMVLLKNTQQELPKEALIYAVMEITTDPERKIWIVSTLSLDKVWRGWIFQDILSFQRWFANNYIFKSTPYIFDSSSNNVRLTPAPKSGSIYGGRFTHINEPYANKPYDFTVLKEIKQKYIGKSFTYDRNNRVFVASEP